MLLFSHDNLFFRPVDIKIQIPSQFIDTERGYNWVFTSRKRLRLSLIAYT